MTRDEEFRKKLNSEMCRMKTFQHKIAKNLPIFTCCEDSKHRVTDRQNGFREGFEMGAIWAERFLEGREKDLQAKYERALRTIESAEKTLHRLKYDWDEGPFAIKGDECAIVFSVADKLYMVRKDLEKD